MVIKESNRVSQVPVRVTPHEVLRKTLVEFVCVTQWTLLFSVIRVGHHSEQILLTMCTNRL